VTRSHAESSRASSGNVTEVEIDAGNEHEPTQQESTVEEDELGDNAVTTDQMPVDLMIAEPTQTEDPPEEDHDETEMEDHIVAPEITISEPSLEHVPDHIEDNAELNSSTEAKAPPQEAGEGEALIQQENDHLAELPFTLGLSRQHRAAQRSRPLGLKRSAKARRQAAAQTHLGGKDQRLTQVDVK
jgi:hypothetical protein